MTPTTLRIRAVDAILAGSAPEVLVALVTTVPVLTGDAVLDLGTTVTSLPDDPDSGVLLDRVAAELTAIATDGRWQQVAVACGDGSQVRHVVAAAVETPRPARLLTLASAAGRGPLLAVLDVATVRISPDPDGGPVQQLAARLVAAMLA